MNMEMNIRFIFFHSKFYTHRSMICRAWSFDPSLNEQKERSSTCQGHNIKYITGILSGLYARVVTRLEQTNGPDETTLPYLSSVVSVLW